MDEGKDETRVCVYIYICIYIDTLKLESDIREFTYPVTETNFLTLLLFFKPTKFK